MAARMDAKSKQADSLWESVVSPAGYVLAVSYPVLALSTGVRAAYQLFVRPDIVDYLPVALSALAALCYLTATLGFAYRRPWTWRLSVTVLAFETLMTVAVGVWSIIDPATVGSTVWRHSARTTAISANPAYHQAGLALVAVDHPRLWRAPAALTQSQ